jgi:hypothetical protein
MIHLRSGAFRDCPGLGVGIRNPTCLPPLWRLPTATVSRPDAAGVWTGDRI